MIFKIRILLKNVYDQTANETKYTMLCIFIIIIFFKESYCRHALPFSVMTIPLVHAEYNFILSLTFLYLCTSVYSSTHSSRCSNLCTVREAGTKALTARALLPLIDPALSPSGGSATHLSMLGRAFKTQQHYQS